MTHLVVTAVAIILFVLLLYALYREAKR